MIALAGKWLVAHAAAGRAPAAHAGLTTTTLST